MMISITRKNLSSFSNPNISFLCNSNAHFLPSIHHFSTSKLRTRLMKIPRPEIYNVLFRKHHFSFEFASSIASAELTKSIIPERVDSVLSLLKENSFTNAQLEKILRYNAQILGYTIEGLEFRFKLFRDLGLSSEEIANMIMYNKKNLLSSVANKIIPSLSILKELLGSNDEVARLLRKCGRFVTSDLKMRLMPNVQILKSSGTPMERVLHFLFVYPRCFLIQPDVMRKSVDKAIEFGVIRTSITFMMAVKTFSHMSQGMWEVKLQNFRDLGFSDDEILTMIGRQPSILSTSQQKLKSVVDLLIDTGKYSTSNIVSFPASLGYSIKMRLEPQLQILGLLESMNLIEKWPCLSGFCSLTEARFLKQFVSPYRDEVGEAFDSMSYLIGKINETRNACLITDTKSLSLGKSKKL